MLDGSLCQRRSFGFVMLDACLGYILDIIGRRSSLFVSSSRCDDRSTTSMTIDNRWLISKWDLSVNLNVALNTLFVPFECLRRITHLAERIDREHVFSNDSIHLEIMIFDIDQIRFERLQRIDRVNIGSGWNDEMLRRKERIKQRTMINVPWHHRWSLDGRLVRRIFPSCSSDEPWAVLCESIHLDRSSQRYLQPNIHCS